MTERFLRGLQSYKLPRAVSSTLGGKTQAMATASGTAEWLSLLLSETLDGPFEAKQARSLLMKRAPILATDCQSLCEPSVPILTDAH